MKYVSFAVIALLTSFASQAQAQSPRPGDVPGPFVAERTLTSQIFPLLASIENQAINNSAWKQDATLAHLTDDRWNQIDSAMRTCGQSVSCLADSLKFEHDQIAAISLHLRTLYQGDKAFRTLIHASLDPHAEYTLAPGDDEETILVDTWERSALAINQIIATYSEGALPHYQQIDAMSYKQNAVDLQADLKSILDNLRLPASGSAAKAGQDDGSSGSLFFVPSLRFAIRLLETNARDEAGRFRPLRDGENKAAIAYEARISWQHYRYSVILIPGAGPETYDVRLPETAVERLRLGVAEFRQGLAPYFLLSGGFVHPSQTRYCEALEMKQYLMEVYGIPERAILIDPYARHTTTNLRNAARMVFDYHLPASRPFLVVSDVAQTNAIVSEAFVQRNSRELGYMPVALGKRLSPNAVEAAPLPVSHLRDPRDPLDP